jgi:hypothetical protein
MKKFFAAIALACLSIPLFATVPLGYVQLSGANLQDSTGTLTTRVHRSAIAPTDLDKSSTAPSLRKSQPAHSLFSLQTRC